jgi:hypothetical protein
MSDGCGCQNVCGCNHAEEVEYPEVTVYQSAEQIPSFSNMAHKAESKFDKLSDKIAKQYEKKGRSPKEAKEIGAKTAYTIGRKKYGKAGMARKARAGMRAESFGADMTQEDLENLYETQDVECNECGGILNPHSSRGPYKKRQLCDCVWSAESFATFDAQGNPDKRTTTQYATFYVGWEDEEGELRGGGKFKKYDDALAQAKIVSDRNGNSRIVSTRGFALWTDDGKGMWQEGYNKADAKKFYSAEDDISIAQGWRLGLGMGLGLMTLSALTTLVAVGLTKRDEGQE